MRSEALVAGETAVIYTVVHNNIIRTNYEPNL